MDKQCQNCEWFDRRCLPNAMRRDPPEPYCTGLGFFLFGNHANDCKMYRPRPGVSNHPSGGR